MKIIYSVFIVLLLGTPAQAQDVSKSTIDDQKSVEVTVYNSNVGLVKDTRTINLSAKTGELRFENVAAQIMPVTVSIKSLNDEENLSVLEQNYEYDLMDQNKLLDKYVGKKIKLIDFNAYQDKKETVEAELLSNNNGQIYKVGNEIYLGHPGFKVVPEIPENLIAEPTLTWMYESLKAKDYDVQVSYLTNNINWKADYVFVVDQKDTLADLNGWVTIDNKSGAIYKNAKLKLVAGEVNRVYDQQRGYDDVVEGRAYLAMEAKSAPQFQEQSFFEYHIYDLQRPTTIKDNQTKQISLLEVSGIGIQKEFVVESQAGYWYGNYMGQDDNKLPVNVKLKFKNSKENNLGMPLPKGVIRLYKEDSAKSLQFIGEDNIDHTPKDEEVKLKIGEAFDVVCERKQMDYKILDNRRFETEWEVTLKNHKEEGVVVSVIEPLNYYAEWKIIESTHSHEKLDAFHIKFDVPVAKDQEVKLKYRVFVKTR